MKQEFSFSVVPQAEKVVDGKDIGQEKSLHQKPATTIAGVDTIHTLKPHRNQMRHRAVTPDGHNDANANQSHG